MAKYRREGACNHCGDCCRHVAAFMRGPRDICRYAILQEDGTYRCRIRDETHALQKPRGIPTEHFVYWFSQCVPYPDPQDPAHCPPRHQLPARCGFKLIRVEP
jgi:hypothetical protein